MSTQMYLMGGLVEGRVPSSRDQRHLRAAKDARKEARAERRAHRARKA
jgi:hypothetical protein